MKVRKVFEKRIHSFRKEIFMISKKQISTIAVFAFTSIAAATANANAVVGSAVGAAVGTAIGQQANGRDGAVIGGAIGGAVGAGIGSEMERNESRERTEVVYEEREVQRPCDRVVYVPVYHHPHGHAWGYYRTRPVIVERRVYRGHPFEGHRWHVARNF
jgi:hypothetical protein